MSDVVIKKCVLNGAVAVPSSKSVAHRMIIASAVSGTRSAVNGILNSKDILATIDCIQGMGVTIENTETGVIVDSTSLKNKRLSFNVKESGSTMRFMLPLLPVYLNEFNIYGEGRISERTVAPLKTALEENGVLVENEFLPTKVSGRYNNNIFRVDGSLSSQYITGILFALTALRGGTLKVEGALTSKGYVDVTIDVLKKYGVEVVFDVENNVYTVDTKKLIAPKSINVNGDWSSACFFIVAGVLNGEIELKGLEYPDSQPDSVIVEIIKKMGGDIVVSERSVKVKKSSLRALDFDADGSPDIVPILAVACAFADGVSTITGTRRLRIKESDRVEAVVNMLQDVGVKTETGENHIKVYGNGSLHSGVVESYNDHRIAMSGVVLGSVIGDVTVKDIECTEKSYPDFMEHFRSLGGNNA